MPSIQKLPSGMADILQGNLHGGTYKHFNEPVGGFEVWNGQFETGPSATQVEGWELHPNAGELINRVSTAPWAGGYHMTGQAVAGAPGYIRSLRYFPVNEGRDYYIAMALRGNVAATTIQFGADCYDSAKAYLGRVNAYSAAPDTTWHIRQRDIGPNGDVAWIQGTRYARVVANWNDATVGRWMYVDDVQFGQLKKTYSPLIRLVNDQVTDFVQRTFNTGVYVLYPGSTFNLTLEEPGYAWIEYQLVYHYNNTAVRNQSHYFAIYIDGAADPGLASGWGSSGIARFQAMHIGTRSQNILARGPHTFDLRLLVINPPDNIVCQYLVGDAFYTRAY